MSCHADGEDGVRAGISENEGIDTGFLVRVEKHFAAEELEG